MSATLGAGASCESFRASLLDWYQAHRRPLPWRNLQNDGYAVWISEVMLQQTTVAAATGYFERWMQRFPTVEALAETPIDEVLRYWSGLGYYGRARNIKRAADAIVSRWGGRLPECVDDLRRLPGIGRYTAGAISSIAYGRDAPVVDVNVARVLARVYGLAVDVKSASAQSLLWRLAEEALPAGRARDFNQGLMELGALICTPRRPNCARCPVTAQCAAIASGDPERFPAPPKPKTWRVAQHTAVALVRHGDLLLVKRPPGSIWAGLWEMPRVIVEPGELQEDSARRAGVHTVGLNIRLGTEFGVLKHVVMDTKITLTGFRATAVTGASPAALSVADFAWVDPCEIASFALSSPQKRLVELWRQCAPDAPHGELP